MKVKVVANPRLHNQFGFSLNFQSIALSGEGSIKKAADLLFEKLDKEGLFAPERKRILPYPPASIGLVTSDESAAYKDFIKVLGERWGGVHIKLANVQVQGESAHKQIAAAIEWFNKQAEIPEVLVIIRGGGSADDLQAFSAEQVTRAVAASRIPTLVAIGHEQDVSLAELAADLRASTPSNAAELLVPDRRESITKLKKHEQTLHETVVTFLENSETRLTDNIARLSEKAEKFYETLEENLDTSRRTLEAYNPKAILRRGYAIVRAGGGVVKTSKLKPDSKIMIEFADGFVRAEVE